MIGAHCLAVQFSTPYKILKAFKVPSSSMKPSIKPGDRILTIKYKSDPNPQRGDIVVFNYPDDETKQFIQRVVGLPGEAIKIKNGGIIINGKPIPSKFHYYNRGDFGKEGQVIHVPENSYYVLGDNSNTSRDSRYFGFVPRKNIIAKAVRIYWPIRRISEVE